MKSRSACFSLRFPARDRLFLYSPQRQRHGWPRSRFLDRLGKRSPKRPNPHSTPPNQKTRDIASMGPSSRITNWRSKARGGFVHAHSAGRRSVTETAFMKMHDAVQRL